MPVLDAVAHYERLLRRAQRRESIPLPMLDLFFELLALCKLLAEKVQVWEDFIDAD